MTSLTLATETVVLFQGDDLARINEMAENFTSTINQAGPRALAEDDPAQEKARELDAFITEAEGRAARVTMTALPRPKWRALLDQHPARMVSTTEKDDEGNEVTVEHVHEDDEGIGFDTEGIADDLVKVAVVEGQFSTDVERDEFIDSLSDPNFNRLYAAAVRLNTQAGGAPKADLSSRLARITAGTSNSPGPSD